MLPWAAPKRRPAEPAVAGVKVAFAPPPPAVEVKGDGEGCGVLGNSGLQFFLYSQGGKNYWDPRLELDPGSEAKGAPQQFPIFSCAFLTICCMIPDSGIPGFFKAWPFLPKSGRARPAHSILPQVVANSMTLLLGVQVWL